MWEFIVRFRNWLVTIAGSLLLLLPDLLAAPELLAVLPEEWHKWVFVATLFLNLAMRWRPATIASDPEVQVSKAIKQAESEPGQTTVVVESGGETTAVIPA